MRAHRLVGLVTVAVVLSAPAWAEAKDLTIRQKVTTTGVRADSHESMQYWTDKQMVTDTPTTRVIVDVGAETTTVVDKGKQTYFTQTFAEMQQQGEAVRAAMEKQMANLSPQAREMMAKMGVGPGASEAAVTIKATGKSEKIAGYEAKEYALEGGPMTGSVWATDALQPPGGIKAREAVSKMVGAMPGSKWAQAVAGIQGLPLRTTIHSAAGGQDFSSTTEAVEVSEKSPPAEVLKVPNGFKKVPPPAFHAPAGRAPAGGQPPHP